MTTATRSEDELTAAIRSAHERGDSAELAKLQEEFRSSGFPVTRTYYGKGAVALRYDKQRSTPATTPSATARSTPKPRILLEPPDIAPRQVSTAVVFTRDADQDLREQLSGDGLEESAWLYGVRDRDEIRVHAIAFASESRTTTNVRLVAEVRDRLAGHFQQVGWSLVGDLHTHPDGNPEPSSTDRLHWSACADQAGATWVGLLATPRHTWEGRDWARPDVDAYLVEPNGSLVWPARVRSAA